MSQAIGKAETTFPMWLIWDVKMFVRCVMMSLAVREKGSARPTNVASSSPTMRRIADTTARLAATPIMAPSTTKRAIVSTAS